MLSVEEIEKLREREKKIKEKGVEGEEEGKDLVESRISGMMKILILSLSWSMVCNKIGHNYPFARRTSADSRINEGAFVGSG